MFSGVATGASKFQGILNSHPKEDLIWGRGLFLGGLDAEEEEVGEVVGDDDVVGVEGGPGLCGLREPDSDVF